MKSDRRRFCIIILIFSIFYCYRCTTGPDKITGIYKVTKLGNTTLEEFSDVYNREPFFSKIELIDYEIGSNNLRGNVLVKDSVWIEFSTPQSDRQFIIYTNNLLNELDGLWFHVDEIDSENINGFIEFVYSDPSIDGGGLKFETSREY